MKNIKKTFKGLPKWARITGIAFVSVLALGLLAWLAASWYISSHKQSILKKITESVSEKLNGNFHIADMKPALLKGFPNVAVALEDVSLSDSMYQVHHQNLFEFKEVYIKLNLFSLLTSHPKVIKVTLADGRMHLFTDKNGYSNNYLLKQKENGKKQKKDNHLEFDQFGIERVLFTFDHVPRDKKIQLMIQKFDGTVVQAGDTMNVTADTRAHIDQLGFKLKKGGYLTNKDFRANMHFSFNPASGDLVLPQQEVRINNTPLLVGAVFHFKNKPVNYTIKVDAASIGYKESVSYLTRTIGEKLKLFDLKKNIALKVSLDGYFKYPDTPVINATWKALKNDFTTPAGVLSNATFNGSFYNNVVPGRGHGDGNTQISIDTLTADYLTIPFLMYDVKMLNLFHPLLNFKLVSSFPVEKLNNVFGNTFLFTKGSAKVNLIYRGAVVANDSLGHSLQGSVHISDGAFTYIPHSMKFDKGNIELLFNGEDLHVKDTRLSTGKSNIVINGSADHFMNFYFSDPGKVVFKWDVHSDALNLDEFKGYVAPKQKQRDAQRTQAFNNVNDRLALLMEKSEMDSHIEIDHLYYKNFAARQLKGDLAILQENITLKNAHLNFAGGTIDASGSIEPGGDLVPYHLKAAIKNVNTSKLFYAFDNFGQTSLTSKNIDGDFTAQIDISGKMNQHAEMLKNSLSGKASFVLTDGRLVNFAPLLSIQKFVFKKRNLSDITFKTLRNNFTITQGKIDIPSMDIASSAIDMNVQGTYAFGTGTDIGIAVPLRNPKKKQERIDNGDEPKKGKGIVVHLRARDGKDGKVKVVWDPFKKAPQKEDLEEDGD